MKKKITLLTLAAGIFFGSHLMAQDALVEHLILACETDIQSYCSQVTLGEGRMLHCMAAHEDKISGRCQYAFYQAATILEQIAQATAYVANQCATDIETHCRDVAMGEGRILMCLSENQAEVSDSCNQAVSDTVGE
jgi:Cysteine rich repeat